MSSGTPILRIFRLGRKPGKRRAFTLIELLTVIAIIAILAGLLLPVFAMVRESARKSSCMSNMHTIIQALKVYHDDWHAYPETLYGGYYRNNGGACNAYPNDFVRKGLFPEYVKSEDTFVCPDAVVRLDSALRSSANSVAALNRTQSNAPSCWAVPAFSSYDFQFIPNATNGTPELRYAKKWTAVGTPLASESQRQLYWRDPPDSTIVTWCGYHAYNATGGINNGGQFVVGFLGGNVKTIGATAMLNTNPWSPTAGPWKQKPSK